MTVAQDKDGLYTGDKVEMRYTKRNLSSSCVEKESHMSNGSQLFKIDPATKQANPAREVDFAQLGFKEKQDIQEWIISNSSILGSW